MFNFQKAMGLRSQKLYFFFESFSQWVSIRKSCRKNFDSLLCFYDTLQLLESFFFGFSHFFIECSWKITSQMADVEQNQIFYISLFDSFSKFICHLWRKRHSPKAVKCHKNEANVRCFYESFFWLELIVCFRIKNIIFGFLNPHHSFLRVEHKIKRKCAIACHRFWWLFRFSTLASN